MPLSLVICSGFGCYLPAGVDSYLFAHVISKGFKDLNGCCLFIIEINTFPSLASPLPRHPSFLRSSYAGTMDDEFACGTMSPSAYLRSISLRR